MLGHRKQSASLSPVTTLDMPDAKWIHKHVHDVADVIRAMKAVEDHAPFVEAGRRLASEWIANAPDELSQTAAGEMIEEGLARSATRGLAFASLYGQDRPTPRPVHEALRWMAFLSLPEVMRGVASAHVFACHAGHFIGNHADADRASVIAGMDWPGVFRSSGMAAVVSDTCTQSWDAIVGRAA
jgi:hypothetical protein